MKNFFALLFASLIATSSAFSQTATADKLKLTAGRMKYNEQDYNGALRIYREEFSKAPDDAMLNYRMGEAHFALKEYELALEKFNAAEKANNAVDGDLYLFLGKTNQALANLDKALEQYEKYRAQDLKKPQMEEINTLIAQVKTAQELLARPVNVVISNPGTPINSKFNDYHPSLTADQKVMVFTSRRGEGKVVGVDANDQGFYEDVYITFWNDTINDWVDAVMAPGAINGLEHDASLSISPDGKQIFMYKNENGGDIYVSKKSASEKWEQRQTDGRN
jgi:tetratricopeptide (TPR) repeat protein